jgi:phosphoribosylformylglycinamidine synthase
MNEKNNGNTVLELIKNDLAMSVHDISDGGLIVSLAEMSMSSDYGVLINKPKKLFNLFEYFFGEDQSRYIVEIKKGNLTDVEKILKKNNVFYENIGNTQKDYFEIQGELKINTKELYKINNQWYNNY